VVPNKGQNTALATLATAESMAIWLSEYRVRFSIHSIEVIAPRANAAVAQRRERLVRAIAEHAERLRIHHRRGDARDHVGAERLLHVEDRLDRGRQTGLEVEQRRDARRRAEVVGNRIAARRRVARFDIDEDIVLVAEAAADAEEATRQLVRIGFTRVGRWLDFGDWTAQDRPVRSVVRRTMSDLAELVLDGGLVTVVDVRQEHEWAGGHLPGAVHALPPAMADLAKQLNPEAPVAVHCESGHRSAVAVSLLLRAGVSDIWHVTDGVGGWQELGNPLVTPS